MSDTLRITTEALAKEWAQGKVGALDFPLTDTERQQLPRPASEAAHETHESLAPVETVADAPHIHSGCCFTADGLGKLELGCGREGVLAEKVDYQAINRYWRARTPHWEKPIKKTIYTLNINNYEPAVCALTYPLIRHYAKKIGAEFQIITERKFPEWPVVYEKLQLFELAKEAGNDWTIYIDSDALVNPECFDITDHLKKDTVAHNGRDMAGIRWKYDQYFRRDGRHFGSCNWFTIASDWCLDLWHPLDDLTPEEAFERITITTNEHNSGQCKREHLIDDFTLSRNIAKFSLKTTTVTDICGALGWRGPQGQSVSPHFFHLYALPTEVKLQRMLEVLSTSLDKGGWALMSADQCAEFRKQWNLKA